MITLNIHLHMHIRRMADREAVSKWFERDVQVQQVPARYDAVLVLPTRWADVRCPARWSLDFTIAGIILRLDTNEDLELLLLASGWAKKE